MEDGTVETETIISPLKIGVRERDEEEDDTTTTDDREKRQKLDTTTHFNGGARLFDNLISKLSSPKSTSTAATFDDDYNHRFDSDIRSDHHQEVYPVPDSGNGDKYRSHGGGGVGGGGDSGGGGGGGGVFNNLINSFFHKNTKDEDEDVNKEKGNDGLTQEEVELEGKSAENETVDEQSENGRINGVSTFMSNLVPEGPEADEASMLIHSVVHD